MERLLVKVQIALTSGSAEPCWSWTCAPGVAAAMSDRGRLVTGIRGRPSPARGIPRRAPRETLYGNQRRSQCPQH